jgi:putative inorganic carbon (hco3(-)) transporter
MLLGILLGLVILVAVLLAFRKPYAFALIYIWFEFFRPKNVAPWAFGSSELPMIIGIATVLALLITSPQRLRALSTELVLCVLFAGWITWTTTSAIVPGAWLKWDWAVKAVLFSALIAHFTHTKEQLEAAIFTMIASSAGQITAVALKTMTGDTGYQSNLGIMGGNTGLGESSTLGLYCSMMMPLVLFFGRHSILVGKNKAALWISRVLAGFCAISLFGTFARTALITGFISLTAVLTRKRGLIFSLVLATITIIGFSTALVSTQWGERMMTTFSYSEDESAMGRVAVWLWTIDYVQSHPFGGGFLIDQTNTFTVDTDTDSGSLTVKGKAFHSIYFEVLGEQGLPGIALFLSIVGISFFKTFKVWNHFRKIEKSGWAHELSSAMLIAWVCLLVGGNFVGIAYLQFVWMMIAFSASLHRVAFADTLAITSNSTLRKSFSPELKTKVNI